MKRPNVQIKESIYWSAKAEADAKKIALSELIENALIFWLSRCAPLPTSPAKKAKS